MKDFNVHFQVRPRRICLFLGRIILSLMLIGIVSAYASTALSTPSEVVSRKVLLTFANKFHLDKEQSIPTYFSSLLLLFASLILGSIAYIKHITKKKFRKHWAFLSLIFLFLSLDEVVGIHERFTSFIKGGFNMEGPGQYAWTMVGAVGVSIFLAAFVTFIIHLPNRSRRDFIIAGCIYVGGALGGEFLGGFAIEYMGGLEGIFYPLFVLLEESMEMFGVLFFIKALFDYIHQNLTNTLIFSE